MTVIPMALLITGIVALILIALWGARRLEVIGVPAGQRSRRVMVIAHEPPPVSFADDLALGIKLPHSDRRMLTPTRRRAVSR